MGHITGTSNTVIEVDGANYEKPSCFFYDGTTISNIGYLATTPDNFRIKNDDDL